METTIYRPKNEADWLKLRQKVLTASDIAVILGLNPWSSVAEMTAKKEGSGIIDNSYMWLGRTLEEVVVKAVNKELNCDFKLFEADGVKKFFVKETLKLGATPDAYYNGGLGDILLECKSTKPGNALKWSHWPPSYYLVQLYVQMYCLDIDFGILGIMSTNMTQRTDELKLPLSIHNIKRDDWIDNVLELEVNRYWDCISKNKQYRVDRKQALIIEAKLRMM